MQLCDSWQFWPPNLCTYVVAASGVYLLLTLLAIIGAIIRSCKRRGINYQHLNSPERRRGPITKSFLFVFLITVAFISLPFIYYFSHLNKFNLKWNWAFWLFACSHTLFWMIAEYELISTSFSNYAPIRVVTIFAVAVLLASPISLFWSNFFPKKFVKFLKRYPNNNILLAPSTQAILFIFSLNWC